MKGLSQVRDRPEDFTVFPELPFEAWKETYETLHRWMQIVGKIKLALMPMWNHWWQVSLHVSAAGLTTTPIPYGKHIFEILFDFINHELVILVNNGKKISIGLYPRSVSDFYRELLMRLDSEGIEVNIWTTPVEIDDRIPFEMDTKHASYDAQYAHRFWLILVQADRVMKEFRAKFTGKTSPVHFFWGSFDMALSVYSGRPAPEFKGEAKNVASYVMKEAMSKEEYACGFWPGAGLGEPAFYAYAYPEPEGCRESEIKPDGAYFNNVTGLFLLPYDLVRKSAHPDKMIHEFFWSTYEAAAIPGKWDRESIEYKTAFHKP